MELAEENFNNPLIPEIVPNILTLRYDPSQNSRLPKLNWKDFTPNVQIISPETVENNIENYLQNNLKQYIS